MYSPEETKNNKSDRQSEPKIMHEEHIIHNALFGKLKSSNILCKSCGSTFGGKEDKDFVSLFFVITERINHLTIPRDHGKAGKNTLKGVLFDDASQKTSKKVSLRDGKVAPLQPFYEYNGEEDHVTIYADKNRGKQYKNVVLKELKNEGYDTEKLKFTFVDDISDQGVLGFHFSEGQTDFNGKFKRGFSKIAIGYAMHCGLKREDIPEALEIDSDGVGHLINKPNLIPFMPLGPTDFLYEVNRPELEEHYPSHTLILFSQKTGLKNFLFCYVELFSTFQYYVLLNDEYSGDELYKPYYQTVIKQDEIDLDVRRVRPKHLSAILESLGIDRSEFKGESLNDLYDFAERKVGNLQFSSIMSLEESLSSSFSKINIAYLAKEVVRSPGNKPFPSLLTEIPEKQKTDYQNEMSNYFHTDDSFQIKHFRQTFFESGEVQSTPWECNREATSENMKAFGHTKFNHISNFINQSKLGSLTSNGT